jgi:RHS repeat-associated protein
MSLTKSGSEYKYDAANNPTTVGAGTYKYDKASELETGPSLTYTYDELGERTKTKPTSGPATTYGYDQAGNLTSVERPKEGEVSEIKDTYAYNGEGLRTSQTISGTTTNLAWDITEGLPLILSDTTNSYIYGPGGVPVEQISGTETPTYLHHDQQGSTRLLTGSTGTVTGKCTYGAYGTPTCEGTTTTPLGYDGQYTSTDTGLIYLRARVYDPSTAQFLTTDPMEALTKAPYNYVHDNPLNESDPAGLCSVNPFSSSSCISEGVEAGVHLAEEHPVATGIVLGVIAVGTGGAALAVEGAVATSALGAASLTAGGGAAALDTSKCLNGDAGACAGAGLGLASLGLSAPELLAARGLIEDASLYRGVAGAGLGLAAYATLADLLRGDPGFLSPLFGC